MRARKPDALDARHLVHGLEQRRKVARGIVRRLVVIDDLPEQLNLAVPLARRLTHFVEDVALRPHPLAAARVRHHAERAELVAAFDDGDVRLHRIVPPRDAERKRHVFVGVDVDARRGIRVGERLADERRQLLEALRADDDVDQVRALEQRAGFLLRHAAGNGDNGRAARLSARLANFPEPRVELLFGALAHAARVDDDDIGIARLGRRLVAGLLQQPRHPLGVVDVHLAAVGFDEIFHPARRRFRFRLAAFAFAFGLCFAFAQQLPRGRARGVRRRRSSNHTRQLLDPLAIRSAARPASACGRSRRSWKCGSARGRRPRFAADA